MMEGQSSEFKEVSEYIPTLEEIQSIFQEIIKGEEYEELRRLEDERGVYLWEIVVTKKDGNVEYGYMRKGKYPEGQSATTAIGAVFYDGDGMPISGDLVAEYNEAEEKWEITS